MSRRAQTPEDLHEWISFEDPDEHRTWVFDATFLASNFMCIYGCGCQGILESPSPELAQGCCSFGAHLADDADTENVRRHFERLQPHHMQFHRTATKKGPFTEGELDDEGQPTAVSRLVDDACVFLNRPGFEGGVGCALHIAALDAGERPLDWKPQVCWQVPIRLEHSQDESGHVTSRLREWKRRDWGEGGSEFGWWCTEEREAFVGDRPLYESAREEIIELVGAAVYKVLVKQLRRAQWVPIQHPVVRKKK